MMDFYGSLSDLVRRSPEMFAPPPGVTIPGADGPPPPPINATGPWQPPDDPRRSLQVDIVVCAAVTWVFAAVFVGLRFYSRAVLRKVVGLEDWMILPAVICACGVSASMFEQAYRGQGKHSWQVDFKQIPSLQRAAWYGILFYWLSLSFTKISILLLYRRFFTYDWARRLNYIVLGMVIVIGVWNAAIVSTACIPLAAFWDWSIYHKSSNVWCQDPRVWLASSGMHIATDLIIFCLPLPVLRTLRLPRKQKIALIGVFTLGFFVCMISVIRLWYLFTMPSGSSFDPTYSGAVLCFWTTIEVNFAISCACVVTFKPLMSRFFPTWLRRTSYDEQRSGAASSPGVGPDHRGRIPTVGSRPMRPTRGGPHTQDESWLDDYLRDDIEVKTSHSLPLEDRTRGEKGSIDLEAARPETGTTTTDARSKETSSALGHLQATPRGHQLHLDVTSGEGETFFDDRSVRTAEASAASMSNPPSAVCAQGRSSRAEDNELDFVSTSGRSELTELGTVVSARSFR